MGNEILLARLTKRFLLSLPAGWFLVSNVGYAPDKPVFAETVASHTDRQAQWARIRQAAVDQRTCHAFPDEAAYRAWVTVSPEQLA